MSITQRSLKRPEEVEHLGGCQSERTQGRRAPQPLVSEESGFSIGKLLIFVSVAAFVGACVGFYYKMDVEPTRLFTKEELAKYRGEPDGSLIYLAVLGEVYDVTKGAKHYALGGAYHFFTGIDGSAAFITGEFNTEGLTDDVSELTAKQIYDLLEWTAFYKKDYTHVGHLIGRYYSESGERTPEWHAVMAAAKEGATNENSMEEVRQVAPHCNSRSKAGEPIELWCSTNSGGTKREWVGVPRLLTIRSIKKKGPTADRCGCVRLDSPPAHPAFTFEVTEFPGCEASSPSCRLDKAVLTAMQEASKAKAPGAPTNPQAPPDVYKGGNSPRDN